MLIAGVECDNPVTSTLALLWRLPKYFFFLSFQLIVWVSFLPFPKIKTKQKRGEGGGKEGKEEKEKKGKGGLPVHHFNYTISSHAPAHNVYFNGAQCLSRTFW